MKRTPPLLTFFWTILLLGVPALGQAPERTTITSETLELQGTDERNFFHFRTDVEVRGTNLEISCDELTVIAFRSAPAAVTEAIGEIGAIESILAVGNVRIRQEGRTAYAGRAEVNPVAGTVTLSESPRIVDGDVEIEGYQFVLFRDQRRFQSIPDPNAPPGQPSRSVVRLGELPDLGFSQAEDTIGVDRTRARDGRRISAETPAVEEVDPTAPPPPPANDNGEDAP
jgi:lipopolysaccharide export system protein LptA